MYGVQDKSRKRIEWEKEKTAGITLGGSMRKEIGKRKREWTDQRYGKQNRQSGSAHRFRLLILLLMFCMSALLLPSKPVHAEETDSSLIRMERMYNPNSSEHFYTADQNEKKYLVSLGWQYEGIGWFAPHQGDPVYRLYNPNAGDHHYTLSEKERDELVSLGWRYEQIGWYSAKNKKVPLYRQYNPNAKAGAHNFTTSRKENDVLVSLGWRAEGISWYAEKEGIPVDNSLRALHVSGTKLLDENNREVVLQGYSTFGLNYMPQYVDERVFQFVKNQMHGQAIRLALYTQEYGGYCSGGNQAELEALIDKGVRLAKQNNLYVIIDWHILSDGNPMIHLNEAKAFFSKMADRYKNEKHVLYEICNEPNGVDWATVKNYANQIIHIIRARDPNGVILVGTPTWSQDVDVAARDPLQGYSNIMYTLHFYAATHKEGICNKLIAAHAAGLPVFVSEFSISSADGNGSLDPASGDAWIQLLDDYHISRIGWALSNKNEASALFTPGSGIPPTLSDLSASGQWFEKIYQARASEDPIPDQLDQPDQPDSSDSQTPEQPGSKDAKVQLTASNSWQSNGRTFTQYMLTIENPGSTPLKNWDAEAVFDGEIRIENSWNAEVSASGNTLKFTPLSWNAEIPAGGKVDSIGVIVSSTKSVHASVHLN